MTTAEVYAYLDARDEWAVLTTIGADGYPHTVALGYYRIEDTIYLGTPARSRKVRNIEANPKVSVLVAKSKASGSWSAVLVRGDAEIIRDDAERLRIEREGRRQRGVPESELPDEPRRGEVVIRVSLGRVTSWDFS
jgi:nitroimidazol reductase NimA-like FMN-containing flavoprotein (pyridoxamine 5'-phosphate oxidase superfamily)